MSYPKSLKQQAIKLAEDGHSPEAIANIFSKEAEKGKHDYYPTPRTIRNWLQRGKEPTNWIEAHKAKTGRLPPAPACLVKFVPDLVEGKPIEPKPIKTPSGQQWLETRPSDIRKLQEYAEWAKAQRPELRSFEDIMWDMERMLPKRAPKRAGRWVPPKQR